jgi:hypothetical protein
MEVKTIGLAAALTLASTLGFAQGNPSGPGATTGDPAASSANPRAQGRAHQSSTSNPSGSGTSPSGGKDDNPDHGFDASFPGMKNNKGKNGK